MPKKKKEDNNKKKKVIRAPLEMSSGDGKLERLDYEEISNFAHIDLVEILETADKLHKLCRNKKIPSLHCIGSGDYPMGALQVPQSKDSEVNLEGLVIALLKTLRSQANINLAIKMPDGSYVDAVDIE